MILRVDQVGMEQSLRTLEKSPAGVKRSCLHLFSILGVQLRHWKACTLGVRTKPESNVCSKFTLTESKAKSQQSSQGIKGVSIFYSFNFSVEIPYVFTHQYDIFP